MAARVRGGAHAVVEHTVRRRRREIEGALDQEPFVPFRAGPIERGREGRQPVGVLVQDMDLWHGGPYCNATNRVGATLQNAVTARMGPKVGKYKAKMEYGFIILSLERKSVVMEKSVYVGVDIGGCIY